MFLTANEAYEITENNIKDIVQEELEYVFGLIQNAMKEGWFGVYCYGNFLRYETREQLKKLGYKVKPYEICEESFYYISWRKDNFLNKFRKK